MKNEMMAVRRRWLVALAALPLLAGAAVVAYRMCGSPLSGSGWGPYAFRTADLVVDDTAAIGGTLAVTGASTMGDRMQLSTSSTAGDALIASLVPVLSAQSNISAVDGRVSGNWDTTAGVVNAIGTSGICTAIRTVGSNDLRCNGIYGEANTGNDNRAVRGIISAIVPGATNRAGVFTNTATFAANDYGVDAQASGIGSVNNWGAFFAASGATTINRALETSVGNVLLNSNGGGTYVGGSTEASALFDVTLGVTRAQSLSVGPATTPAALAAGTTNDWNPTSCAPMAGNCVPSTTFVRASTTGVPLAVVTGMVGPGGGSRAGLRAVVCNFGPGPIRVTDHDAASAAGNRFFLSNSVSTPTTLTIAYGACQEFSYDNVGFWWPIGTTGTDAPITAGPGPALSSCGGSPAISGDNSSGTVTEGTAATGCTVTFANGGWNNYADVPHCSVSSQAGLVFSYAVSKTTLVITNVGLLSGTSVDYNCHQTRPSP